MIARPDLAWTTLFELRAVKAIERLIWRRWGLALGSIDATTGRVCPPGQRTTPGPHNVCQVIQGRHAGEQACRATALEVLRHLGADTARLDSPPFAISCHAGLHEMVAPIVIDGERHGALIAGGYWTHDAPGRDEADVRAAHRARLDQRTAPLALTTSEYHAARARQRILDATEESLLGDLLAAAADEIVLFHGEALARWRRHASERRDRHRYGSIIGKSAPIQALFSVLDRVVQADTTILIQGENGTGKELVARAIHDNSARKSRRFLVTNCSAFNDNLLDSELFGHKKGAFTGAVADKHGLFEVADQGTFFLDEIGDMSPTLQVKLLRVLQEGTFTPVGDTELRTVDVRIIAATNRDLKAMVDRGAFREDLYYRINVINLVIPPLRERRDDMSLLIAHFLDKQTKGGRFAAKQLSDACTARLLTYAWPGNIRELENEIERLVVLAGDDRVIDEPLLSPRIRHHVADATAAVTTASLPGAAAELERRMIRAALERHGWNKTRAAAELEVSRRNLIRLVQKYDIEADRPS